MRRFVIASFLALSAGQGFAAELRPMEPVFAKVGDRDAVIYYVANGAAFDVVVTFAANAPDDGTSMRSVVALLPGQHSTLSVGRAPGQEPSVVTLRREADRLTVETPATQTALN